MSSVLRSHPLDLLAITLCLAVVTTGGCSSGSSSSSSSSSASSSPDARYHEDVRVATKEWLLAGGDVDSFKREISKMARDHGITDWLNDEGTLEAIGAGIKLSGVRGERLVNVKSQIADLNERAAKWIQEGYEDQDAP